MTYQLSWLIPDHVLLIDYSGHLEVDEILEQIGETTEMIESSPRPLVHILVDLRGVQSYSKRLGEYAKLMVPPAHNLGWTIIISENRMMRFIVNVVVNRIAQRFVSLRLGYVDSYGQVIRFLEQRDHDISHLEMSRAMQALQNSKESHTS